MTGWRTHNGRIMRVKLPFVYILASHKNGTLVMKNKHNTSSSGLTRGSTQEVEKRLGRKMVMHESLRMKEREDGSPGQAGG
jgi:hypothetical protein